MKKLFILFFFPFFLSSELLAATNKIFDVIKTEPQNSKDLVFDSYIYQPSEETAELDLYGPDVLSVLTYSRKDSKEIQARMIITDKSLCQKKVSDWKCDAFENIISKKPTVVGSDISSSRLKGLDFGTVFLENVEFDGFEGTDSSRALIVGEGNGGVNQLAVYIYAKKGSNLIQIAAPLLTCDTRDLSKKEDQCRNKFSRSSPPIMADKDGCYKMYDSRGNFVGSSISIKDEAEFIKKKCITGKTIEMAKARLKILADTFKLKK